jgi:hypothetical protein
VGGAAVPPRGLGLSQSAPSLALSPPALGGFLNSPWRNPACHSNQNLSAAQLFGRSPVESFLAAPGSSGSGGWGEDDELQFSASVCSTPPMSPSQPPRVAGSQAAGLGGLGGLGGWGSLPPSGSGSRFFADAGEGAAWARPPQPLAARRELGGGGWN